ncbi:MAG: DUF3017 domain-containing protein [Nocardioidaceae bacterium]|nr:DUF3017 domain-containing protein [Nocardioidaceae bacterium]
MFAGLVIVAAADWRVGIRIVAGALGAAGLLRLLVPEKDAGMLAVRHRLLDVAIVVAAGVTLFVLSVTIPDQPM